MGSHNEITSKNRAFEFQLDLIKQELQTLQTTIDKFDDLTQKCKNWTILLWGSAVILALGGKEQTDFKGGFIFTVIIPLLFWILDAWWRRNQRMFIFRMSLISEFLNGPAYLTSFERSQIVGLKLFDLKANDIAVKNEREKFSSLRRTLLFKSVVIFYGGLILFSMFLQLYLGNKK